MSNKEKNDMKKKIIFLLFLFALLLFTGCNKETVTVTFDGNGGNYISGELTQTITKGKKAKAPKFELEGFDLSWDQSLSSIQEDVTIHAVWKKNGYGLKGFSVVEDNETHQKMWSIRLPNVLGAIVLEEYEDLSEGVRVTYYQDEEGQKPLDSSVAMLSIGDNYVYVQITKDQETTMATIHIRRRKIYQVFFETFCDTHIDYVEVEEDQLLEEPKVELKRDGFQFQGWNYDFSKPVTSTLKVQAKWKGNTYEVTLDPNEGEISNTKAYVTCGEEADLETPTREGYDFMGWMYDGKLVNTSSWNIPQNVALTAQWERSEMTFEIDYVIVGAVGPNLDRTYSNKQELKLKKPYKSGYEFLGWYYDSNFNGEPVTVIPKGTEGNIRLYSKWQEYVLKGKKVSFLGDSITTFYAENSPVNSYYHGNNQYYYPIYSTSVKNVDQTWWKIFVDQTETTLVTNEAYSGSMVTGTGESVGTNITRIKHLRNDTLGDPDLIIVYLGTNDFIYSNRETYQVSLTEFEDAYRLMVERICENYPMADIFLGTLAYESNSEHNHKDHNSPQEIDEKRNEFNQIIRKIAMENYVQIIDLASTITRANYATYLGDSVHPNAEGMKLFAQKTIEDVKSYLGI